MQLPVTRRLPPRESTPFGAWALLGFGAGFVAGFLLRERFGKGGKTRVARWVKALGRGPSPKESPIALAARVKAVLAQEPWLTGESVEPLPAGTYGVALHGWVPSRAIRTRAWRLAQSLASPAPVANRLLVRGEDDGPTLLDDDEEPRSA
jgi:hypothetical protein